MDTPAEKSDPPQNAEPPADDGSEGEQEAEDWGDEFNQMAPKATAKAASRGKGRGRGRPRQSRRQVGQARKESLSPAASALAAHSQNTQGAASVQQTIIKKPGTIWCIKEEAARASRRKSEARSMRP